MRSMPDTITDPFNSSPQVFEMVSLETLSKEDRRNGRCECGGRIAVVNSYEICESCGKYSI